MFRIQVTIEGMKVREESRMAKGITKAQAKTWQKRWALVNDFTFAEALQVPILDRVRVQGKLMGLARSHPFRAESDAGVMQARRRWLRIKKAYRGSP